LVCSITSFAQVGIGTTSPNTKSLLDLTSTTTGLLIPRMTQTERLAMSLSGTETGLLVYQPIAGTTSPAGLYSYDGASWKQYATSASPGTEGSTLRWSINNGWVTTTNIYNGGGSIGIGTLTPSEKMQFNSGGDSRIRFTNTATGTTQTDGLLIGVLSTTGDGQFLHVEARPLTFGTSNIERMRIDAAGNVGINRTNPTAALDVNGTAKIGANGSEITGIIRTSSMVDIPNLAGNSEGMDTIAIPNVVVGATVNVSASTPVPHVMVGNARVVSNGNVEIQFMNMSSMVTDPAALMFYITVIQ